MYTQFILVLLVTGAIAVNQENENGEFGNADSGQSSSIRRISKRAVKVPYAPALVPNRMYHLQEKIEEFSRKTYAVCRTSEGNIAERTRNERAILEKQFHGIKASAKAKQAQEMQEAKAKGHGEDVEKIEVCVKNEQAQYIMDLEGEFGKAKKCVEDVSRTAKKKADEARRYYNDNSYASEHQAKEIKSRWLPCVRGSFYDKYCIEDIIYEYMSRIDVTDGVSGTAIPMSREADKWHRLDLMQCQKKTEKELKELQAEHGRALRDCSENPQGPWAFNWFL